MSFNTFQFDRVQTQMLKIIYVEQHLLVVTSNAIPVFNQYLLYCCTEITCSFGRLNNNQITHLSYIYARTCRFQRYWWV